MFKPIPPIKRNPNYAESNITVIAVTQDAYARAQFFIVESDQGRTPALKFPGLRFRAPLTNKQTLEDSAAAYFKKQTGLEIKMLGLRAIMPTRSRHSGQWIFRNIFLGVVENVSTRKRSDGRKVYVASPGTGYQDHLELVPELGNSNNKVPLTWVVDDNRTVARLAKRILSTFDWKTLTTDWLKIIPCVSAEPLTNSTYRPLGCGLAVASMIVPYKANPKDYTRTISLLRKGDKYPGYAGGKIETLVSEESENIDPISCCAQEGSQEFGFDIQPRALVSVSVTPLEVPNGKRDDYYNSIITYFFEAQPTNPKKVAQALENPKKFLEGKMESYVVEGLDEHKDRLGRGEMRMPDMIPNGLQYYKTGPGGKIPLTQIISSGYT